jgi:hypothetical protein
LICLHISHLLRKSIPWFFAHTEGFARNDCGTPTPDAFEWLVGVHRIGLERPEIELRRLAGKWSWERLFFQWNCVGEVFERKWAIVVDSITRMMERRVWSSVILIMAGLEMTQQLHNWGRQERWCLMCSGH